MFEELTAFLPKLKEGEFGKWRGGLQKGKHGGSDYIELPWVEYSQTIMDFIQTIGRFVETHEEMRLSQYAELLKQKGIDWKDESMSNADVSQWGGDAVTALIVAAYRADRFCEGALLGFLENGSIKRWLERLLQIDESNSEGVPLLTH